MTLAAKIARERATDHSRGGLRHLGLRDAWAAGRVGGVRSSVAELHYGPVSVVRGRPPGERATLGCGCSLIKFAGDLHSVMVDRCPLHRIYQLRDDGAP